MMMFAVFDPRSDLIELDEEDQTMPYSTDQSFCLEKLKKKKNEKKKQ